MPKKSQFEDKGNEWPTTPMIMALQKGDEKIQLRYAMEYLRLSTKMKKPKVKTHQEKLGRQSYTGVGSVRHWVWENRAAGYRVYISKRGIGFEVQADFTARQAMRAWRLYRAAMLGIS